MDDRIAKVLSAITRVEEMWTNNTRGLHWRILIGRKLLTVKW